MARVQGEVFRPARVTRGEPRDTLATFSANHKVFQYHSFVELQQYVNVGGCMVACLHKLCRLCVIISTLKFISESNITDF